MWRIFMRRGNQFHGAIEEQRGNFEFPKLHIIDVSFNRFSGDFPFQQFQNWIAMKVLNASKLSYLHANVEFQNQLQSPFTYSVTITSKATDRDYEKIQDFLVAIDFSSNSFKGCIPENMGSL
ncbi:hypothetical protein PTKIN_Ptkin15bG0156900 [Pterospermum kingtungense]